MDNYDVSLAYRGDRTDDNLIDVRDFAPSLLAFADLVDGANDALNRGAARTRVRIHSEFRPGSFESALSLLLDPATAEAARMLVPMADAVGLTTLPQMINALFGENGAVPRIRAMFGDGSSSTGGATTTQAAREHGVNVTSTGDKAVILVNSVVVLNAGAAFSDVIDGKGIREIVVKPRDRTHALATIDVEDARALRRASAITRRFDEREMFSEMRLELKSVALDFRSTWRFAVGRTKYAVRMQDSDFERRVVRKEVVFRSSDMYRMDMLTRMYHDHRGELRADYICLKVSEITHGDGPQIPLDFN